MLPLPLSDPMVGLSTGSRRHPTFSTAVCAAGLREKPSAPALSVVTDMQRFLVHQAHAVHHAVATRSCLSCNAGLAASACQALAARDRPAPFKIRYNVEGLGQRCRFGSISLKSRCCAVILERASHQLHHRDLPLRFCDAKGAASRCSAAEGLAVENLRRPATASSICSAASIDPCRKRSSDPSPLGCNPPARPCPLLSISAAVRVHGAG